MNKAGKLTVADYEEVLADHRRLVRELDAAMNGKEGAAKQASLCDLIPQAKAMRARIKDLEEQVGALEDEILYGDDHL